MSNFVECVESTDPFLQSNIFSDWKQDYTQLSCGAFKGGVLRRSVGNVQVFREWMNQSIEQKAAANEDVTLIGVKLHKSTSSFQNRELTESSLFFLPAGDESRFNAAGQSDLIGVTVDSSFLDSLSFDLYGVSAQSLTNDNPVIRCASEQVSMFASLLLNSLCSAIRSPKSMEANYSIEQLPEDLVVTALQALKGSNSKVGSRPHDYKVQRNIIDRARLFALEHPTSNPTVAGLCEHLGMSRRGLYDVFMKLLGVNPSTYLRQLRLHGVRKDILLEPHSSVTEIAFRWGFWHLGVFSQYYKEQFGELPSKTQRNPPCLKSMSW
ncbi:helix-turn-helix domain-containing protein [Marinomonas sp.]|uniref:helix-turn-helix domain-containing protein n=1 Tax=Marinomonas sp. TaxID=1904862 RepID=UPI003BA9738A